MCIIQHHNKNTAALTAAGSTKLAKVLKGAKVHNPAHYVFY